MTQSVRKLNCCQSNSFTCYQDRYSTEMTFWWKLGHLYLLFRVDSWWHPSWSWFRDKFLEKIEGEVQSSRTRPTLLVPLYQACFCPASSPMRPTSKTFLKLRCNFFLFGLKSFHISAMSFFLYFLLLLLQQGNCDETTKNKNTTSSIEETCERMAEMCTYTLPRLEKETNFTDCQVALLL